MIKSSNTILLVIILCFCGCVKGYHSANPKCCITVPIVTITKVDNCAGYIVISGEITNPTSSPVMMPDVCGTDEQEGVYNTTILGLIERLNGKTWDQVSYFNDAVYVLVPLQAGSKVRFRGVTSVPFPERNQLFRLSWEGMCPVVFQASAIGDPDQAVPVDK